MLPYQPGSGDVAPEPGGPVYAGKEASPPQRRNHTLPLVYEALFTGAFNMFNSFLVAWFFYHNDPVIPVWGMNGVVFNSLPSSFMPAFMITLVATPLLRQRAVKSMQGPPVSPPEWPLIARLPAPLLLRSLAMGVGAAVITVPLTILYVAIVGATALDYGWFMETQMVQAGILGLVVGPLVGARRLIEPRRPRRGASADK